MRPKVEFIQYAQIDVESGKWLVSAKVMKDGEEFAKRSWIIDELEQAVNFPNLFLENRMMLALENTNYSFEPQQRDWHEPEEYNI